MFDARQVLNRAADLLESRGHVGVTLSGGQRRWSHGPLSLHSSIRIACDMDPDDSFFAYWQWREIGPFLDEVWYSLDQQASALANEKVPALVWTNRPDSTTEEVVDLLRRASVPDSLTISSVTRRPPRNQKFTSGGSVSPAKSTFLLGDGTLQTSVMVSILVLKEIADVNCGDLLSELSRMSLSNQELLAYVDDRIRDVIPKPEDIPELGFLVVARLLVQANDVVAGLISGDAERAAPLSVCGFLAHSEDEANWSGLSDRAVVERLERIAASAKVENLADRAVPKEVARDLERLREAWA